MTVGEKIQYYRKKIGLSQEELGQKLLVSRQTVSLWEMDKTLPTVDNLIRLKEVFSVSIDDILSEDEPIEENKNEPKETYVFQYDKSEMLAVYDMVNSPILKRLLIVLIASIALSLIALLLKGNHIFVGMLLGYTFVCLYSFLDFRKSFRNGKNNVTQKTFSCDVFDEYFVLKKYKNDDLTIVEKIYFDSIKKIRVLDKYLIIFTSPNTFFTIRRDALAPDSAFATIGNKSQNGDRAKKTQMALRITSIVLFVLSICTISGAMIGIAVLSGINQAMTENMWLFFLFLPIPIASIVFGFYLKKKGYKYKKNVIVGIIMAALLCIYGSFTFLFSNIYSHSDEPIVNTEQMLNIDIPKHSRINTQDWTKVTQSVPRGYIYSTSDIYFDDAAVEQFEKNISNDAKWISDIPNDMVGITSYFCDIQTSDYYIIYNKDTGEFNKLPSSSGTYVFINILYNAEKNTMKLVEYQIEYTKSHGG